VDGGDDVVRGAGLVSLVDGLPRLFHGFGRAPEVASEELGLDPAGGDLGDAYPLADRVVADLAGDLVHRGLCRVVGRMAVEVVEAGGAGDVHDVSSVPFDHARQEYPDQLEHGADVDIDQVLEVLARRATQVDNAV